MDLKSYFTTEDVVAVGLSGGKDSMALLNALLEVLPKNRVKAVNVEHGIRGENSVKDTLFVIDYCKSRGVELKCYKADVPKFCQDKKLSIEEGARIIRYTCFNQAVQEGFCTKVATAHHLSDSVETVMFNLFRGASPAGVGKIKQTGNIIRPFADVTRQEIDLYVDNNRIPYVTDETNLQEEYTRNYLRNKVLPLVKNQFPEYEKAVIRFSQLATEQDDYILEQAKGLLQINDSEISFPQNIHPALFHKCTVLALKQMGMEKDYELRHVTEIEKLLQRKNGDVIDLPKGIKAVKDYGKITLFTQTQTQTQTIPFKIGKTLVGDKLITVEKFHEKQNIRFDLDKMPTSCVFRSRQEGDEFTPFGGKKTKLKKYLINKKIPSRQRDNLILVADGKEVYLIVGVEISDKIKVEPSTIKIYTIY